MTILPKIRESTQAEKHCLLAQNYYILSKYHFMCIYRCIRVEFQVLIKRIVAFTLDVFLFKKHIKIRTKIISEKVFEV